MMTWLIETNSAGGNAPYGLPMVRTLRSWPGISSSLKHFIVSPSVATPCQRNESHAAWKSCPPLGLILAWVRRLRRNWSEIVWPVVRNTIGLFFSKQEASFEQRWRWVLFLVVEARSRLLFYVNIVQS